MNNKLTTNSPDLRDALYALSVAKPIPDAEVLDDIVRQYPQFAEELTDFAVTLVLEGFHDQATDKTTDEVISAPNHVSPVLSRAMSHFQNRLYSARKVAGSEKTSQGNSTNSDENPFAKLRRKFTP